MVNVSAFSKNLHVCFVWILWGLTLHLGNKALRSNHIEKQNGF